MPKVVDHEERRAHIADALWRIVLRDGFAAASVRSVAAEGGWSAGSVRHYFSSQGDLIGFAMATLSERVQARVEARAQGAVDFDGLVALLEEVLPLDAQRRAETEVWMALVAAARTDDRLRPLTEQAHRDLRRLAESVVMVLAGRGDGGSSSPSLAVDPVTETDRLHALVDGLALHGSFGTRLMPVKRIRAALLAHLEDLAARAAAQAES
ncbi:MAG: TetR/AcrR family transcriptional regulator [Oryzihumus sp.]